MVFLKTVRDTVITSHLLIMKLHLAIINLGVNSKSFDLDAVCPPTGLCAGNLVPSLVVWKAEGPSRAA